MRIDVILESVNKKSKQKHADTCKKKRTDAAYSYGLLKRAYNTNTLHRSFLLAGIRYALLALLVYRLSITSILILKKTLLAKLFPLYK